MGEFSPPFFWPLFLIFFFCYPSNIEKIFDFSDIITKIHPPFQNPGSALGIFDLIWPSFGAPQWGFWPKILLKSQMPHICPGSPPPPTLRLIIDRCIIITDLRMILQIYQLSNLKNGSVSLWPYFDIQFSVIYFTYLKVLYRTPIVDRIIIYFLGITIRTWCNI